MATTQNETPISAKYRKEKETKLQDVWPTVESALEEYGIDCELNLAQGCMTISKTAMTKGENYFANAKSLIENLATTNVPPRLAVELFKGVQTHIYIPIWYAAAKAGVSKDEFVRRRECLAASLEELATRFYCSLFLSADNIVVIGGDDQLTAVKIITTYCIFHGLHPFKFLNKPTDRPYTGNELLNLHVEYTKTGPPLDAHDMPEVTSICRSFFTNRVKEVQEAWPFMLSFYDKYGILCTMNMAKRSITISTIRKTKDLDIVENAGDFLQLLGRTSIPATKAIEVLNGLLHYEVIQTWFGYGGLCTKYEIEENWLQNYQRLKRNSQALGRLLKCEIYIKDQFAVAVGTSPEGVSLFRSIVECCFIKNEDPLTVGRRLKLDRETYRILKKLARLRL